MKSFSLPLSLSLPATPVNSLSPKTSRLLHSFANIATIFYLHRLSSLIITAPQSFNYLGIQRFCERAAAGLIMQLNAFCWALLDGCYRISIIDRFLQPTVYFILVVSSKFPFKNYRLFLATSSAVLTQCCLCLMLYKYSRTYIIYCIDGLIIHPLSRQFVRMSQLNAP